MQDQTPNPKADLEVTGRPWWKACLIVAVVGLIAIFLSSFLVVRFFGGVGPRTMRELPANFPSTLIVYRMGLVKSIVYYPAEEKVKPIRMIMSPVLSAMKFFGQGSGVADSVGGYLNALKRNESVTMTWTDMDAPVDEIVSFYAGSMRTAGVSDPQMRQTDEKDVSELKGVTDQGVTIDVLIVDDKATPKVDTVTVTVEYPSGK